MRPWSTRPKEGLGQCRPARREDDQTGVGHSEMGVGVNMSSLMMKIVLRDRWGEEMGMGLGLGLGLMVVTWSDDPRPEPLR